MLFFFFPKKNFIFHCFGKTHQVFHFQNVLSDLIYYYYSLESETENKEILVKSSYISFNFPGVQAPPAPLLTLVRSVVKVGEGSDMRRLLMSSYLKLKRAQAGFLE